MEKNVDRGIDKITLKFFADILYIKKTICFEELEEIMEAKDFSDLDVIIDKMLRGDYNALKRGEGYLQYASDSSAS